MINPRILRLNNMLLSRSNPMDPFYCYVSDIHEYDYFFEDGEKLLMGDNRVSPVALSAALLKRLGFNKGENENEYEFISETDDEKIRLILKKGALYFESIRVNIYTKDEAKPEFYFQGLLLYIHDLQNAYNLLTNRELDTSKMSEE